MYQPDTIELERSNPPETTNQDEYLNDPIPPSDMELAHAAQPASEMTSPPIHTNMDQTGSPIENQPEVEKPEMDSLKSEAEAETDNLTFNADDVFQKTDEENDAAEATQTGSRSEEMTGSDEAAKNSSNSESENSNQNETSRNDENE